MHNTRRWCFSNDLAYEMNTAISSAFYICSVFWHYFLNIVYFSTGLNFNPLCRTETQLFLLIGYTVSLHATRIHIIYHRCHTTTSSAAAAITLLLYNSD